MYVSHCDALACRFEQGILHLTLNRPDCGNLLNYAVLIELRDILRQVPGDDEVRAVVLDGAGENFCRGDAWPDMGDWPEEYASRRPGGPHGAAPLPEQDAICALRDLMKPTIALMRGETMGLGLDLAAVCDLRIATPDARIGDPRILQGRAAATGITYLMPRLIGLSQANRILLTGEVLSGEEAHRIQLVHKLLSSADFEAEATEVVKAIARLPTRAWEVHKLQVIPQLDMSFDASLTHCLGVRQTHVIEDRREGMQAWLERRQPEFKGR